MRDKRSQAFWVTVLFYALAGPLIGLLSYIVIFSVVDAWDVAANRLAILISDVKTSWCPSPYSDHFDPGCFQRGPDPRQFDFPLGLQLQHLPTVIFFTYVVGFIPALLAGFSICAAGFRDGWIGFSYAVLIGTLIGLATGALAIYKLESAILLFSICLIATIVCWFIARRWWRGIVADVNSDIGP